MYLDQITLQRYLEDHAYEEGKELYLGGFDDSRDTSPYARFGVYMHIAKHFKLDAKRIKDAFDAGQKGL